MAKRKAKKRAHKRPRHKARRRTGAAGKLPKSAVTLIVILRAKEGQETLLEAELRALVTHTRKDEGCTTFELHRSADGPGGFLLHEVWETREDHAAHTRTRHFLRWNARKDSLLISRDATFWKRVV